MESRYISPSCYHQEIDEAERILQESIISDLNKIRSRQSRTSSSTGEPTNKLSTSLESDILSSVSGITKPCEVSDDVFGSSTCNPQDEEETVQQTDVKEVNYVAVYFYVVFCVLGVE